MEIESTVQKLDLKLVLPKEYINKYVSVEKNSLKSNVRNQFENSVNVTRFLQIDEKFFYNLGLWCGDKYWFGNSVGITNTNEKLLDEFMKFLERIVKERKMLKKVSINNGDASRVKINSGLIRRILENLEQDRETLIQRENELLAYLSGRIDADGTLMLYAVKYRTSPIKITYGSLEEARKDFSLLKKFNISGWISTYKNRNAYDLKISFNSAVKILSKLFLKDEKKQQKVFLLRELIER
ncbi:MAG: hypothetical protein HYT70_02835 [Candidatus Aenigmarchaeota archaeon]|nr:hypothetical protein [Candidatus Aenigmarchaeota archaeon]